MATADEAKLANNKMGSNIKAEVDPVWVGCIDFDASQGKTWYDCLIHLGKLCRYLPLLIPL